MFTLRGLGPFNQQIGPSVDSSAQSAQIAARGRASVVNLEAHFGPKKVFKFMPKARAAPLLEIQFTLSKFDRMLRYECNRWCAPKSDVVRF